MGGVLLAMIPATADVDLWFELAVLVAIMLLMAWGYMHENRTRPPEEQGGPEQWNLEPPPDSDAEVPPSPPPPLVWCASYTFQSDWDPHANTAWDTWSATSVNFAGGDVAIAPVA
ncbi:MAG TPA: hypothetical protein VMS45_11440 [Gemmatimonadaceae bacterium]|jgi:hypothetical protein|nr:hypothetical protein [Gemmatimonadaceae bacterium]